MNIIELKDDDKLDDISNGIVEISATEPLDDDTSSSGATEPSGPLYRDKSGQLIFDPKFPESLSRFKGTGLETLHDVGKTVMGGASRLARGVLPLPYDIMDAFGDKGGKILGENVRKNIPIIPANTTLSHLGQALIQYGTPQATTVRLVNNLSRGLPSAVTAMRQILAGGFSDFLAATPEEGTIGDIVGGPTEGKESDTPLQRKLKIGIEGAAVPALLQPAWAGVGALKNVIKRSFKVMVNPHSVIEKYLSKTLRAAVPDIDTAIKNINETIMLTEGTGFLPSTGTASGLPGLLTIEKGVSNEPGASVIFLERFLDNKKAINSQLESVTKAMEGSTEATRSYMEEHIAKPLRMAKDRLEVLEMRLGKANEETKYFIKEFSEQGGKQADASEFLNSAIRGQLDEMTTKKNALYSAIDPDNSVEIPKTRLAKVLNEITKQTSRLDATPGKLPKDVINRLKEAVLPPTKGIDDVQLTFGELQDIRPDLSEAISKALDENQGDVVNRLTRLKRAVEMETHYLEESGGEAAIRAKRANDYYMKEYVPRFKKEVGDAYRTAIRKGKPVVPTEVGKIFLSPRSGAREAAVQLQDILKNAPNKIEAEVAIRDHLVSNIADLMSDSNGKAIVDRVDKFMKSRPVRETLEQFPDIKREFLEFRNNIFRKVGVENDLTKEIKTAKEVLKITEKQQRKNAARFFVDTDPTIAVGRVFKSLDPENEMKNLVAAARTDPSGEAIKGLKVALNDYVDETTRNTLNILGSETLDLSRAKVTSMLANPRTRNALKQLYTPDEIKTLDKVQDMLELIERVNIKATSGSPTQPLQAAAQKVQVMLFSSIGLIRGRGVFMIGRLIQKLTGRDPIEITRKMIADSMLDPELAKTMLMEDIPINRKIAKAHFTKYILNNILTEEKEDVKEKYHHFFGDQNE